MDKKRSERSRDRKDESPRRDKKKHKRRSRSRSGDRHGHKSSKHRRRSESSDRKRDSRRRDKSAERHRHDESKRKSRSRSRDNRKQREEKRPTVKETRQDVNKTESAVKPVNTLPPASVQPQSSITATSTAQIQVPSFYNPSAINPHVYAEQQRKRKLLWSKSKDNENTKTQIVGQAMLEGQDERTAEKFRKLMGIKTPSTDQSSSATGSDQVSKVNEMQKQAFELMNKEYEMARLATHLNRGKGLGFASHH